jgi:hypothetical protein
MLSRTGRIRDKKESSDAMGLVRDEGLRRDHRGWNRAGPPSRKGRDPREANGIPIVMTVRQPHLAL